MTCNKELLNRIIRGVCEPLIAEWGIHAVQDEFNHAIRQIENGPAEGGTKSRQNRSLLQNKEREKFAAYLVKKQDISHKKKDILYVIAKKYDEKAFLPRLSDVRNFITMSGGDTKVNIKDRNSAFRVLLNLIENFSDKQLELLLQSADRSGPTRLAPISEAISSVSETRARRSHGDKG